jgi:hypothetical protein
MGALEVGAGIVCDEVRREDNGKLILIGVYPSNIVVAELPAVLVLWLVLKLEATEPVDATFEFRVSLNGQQLRTGKGRIPIRTQGPSWIVLPSILLDKITTEGRLAFEVRTPGEESWMTACWLPLTVKRPSGATAPQSPS